MTLQLNWGSCCVAYFKTEISWSQPMVHFLRKLIILRRSQGHLFPVSSLCMIAFLDMFLVTRTATFPSYAEVYYKLTTGPKLNIQPG